MHSPSPRCALQAENGALAQEADFPGSEPMGPFWHRTYRQLADAATPLFYRFSAYVVLTMLDDPAMLALAFC